MDASLSEATRLMGLEAAVELAKARGAWTSVVGPEVAAHSWPVALSHGRLTVATDHPAWASELRILSQQLVSGIRSVVPSVESVAVQVSPFPGRNW